MNKFIIFLTKIITIPIVNKTKRAKIQNKICNYIFTFNIRKKSKHIGRNFRCGTFCSLGPNVEIGDEVWISECKVTHKMNPKAKIKIGNYVAIGAEVLIITASHNYNSDKIPFNEEYIEKDVIIKDFAWIGSRVTLLPGTVIGKGAIVQAGSCVHGNIPDYAIVGGNPAKVFSQRDINKFKLLEENKCFLIRN